MIDVIGELLRGDRREPSQHGEVSMLAEARQATINGLVYVTGLARELADQQVAIARAEQEATTSNLGAIAAQPEAVTPVIDLETQRKERATASGAPTIPTLPDGSPDMKEIMSNVQNAA